LDFEALHVVVGFFSKELMLELEAYALMEKRMMKLGTCFLFMFSIPDCFEFVFSSL